MILGTGLHSEEFGLGKSPESQRALVYFWFSSGA